MNDTPFIWNKGEEEFLRKVMKTSPWQPLAAELQNAIDQRDFCMGEIERLRKERDEAREALRVLFKDYKELADSGDAGFWELEDKEAAQPALRILQQREAAK